MEGGNLTNAVAAMLGKDRQKRLFAALLTLVIVQ